MFSDYIISGKWIEHLQKADISNNENPSEALEKSKETISLAENTYDVPEGKVDLIKSRLRTTDLDPAENPEEPEVTNSTKASSILATCFSSEQLKSILLAIMFPIFLQSEEYQNFVNTNIPLKEGQVATATTGNSDSENLKDREERLDELFQPRQQRINDIIASAASSIDKKEIDSMLVNGDWLTNILATVEELPLCVSIATARSDRRGFPLIYVNKCFSEVTGYERNEIVGQNCKFLQSDKSEPEQVAKLIDALSKAHPCKVALTNKRKDGSEFMNLLAMKPIFDSNGDYAYVIGVQYDISKEGASLKEIKMVDDLLSILPNIFK